MEQERAYEKLVLMDFGAPWCEPCQLLEEELNQVEAEMKDVLTVIRVNVDEEKQLVSELGIGAVPTLLIVDRGVAVTQAAGFMPKEAIIDMVDKYL